MRMLSIASAVGYPKLAQISGFKITRNMQRDYINVMRYKRAGWHVLTVWECQLKGKEQQLQTLMALSHKINSIILDSYRLPKRYDFEPEEEMAMVAEESFDYEKK